MDKEALKDDLKKYYGLHPHNSPSNICIGDVFFRNQIEAKYQNTIANLMEIVDIRKD